MIKNYSIFLKKNFSLVLLFFPLLTHAQINLSNYPAQSIGPNLNWYQIQLDSMWGGAQHINVLEIHQSYHFSIAYQTDTLIKTSDFAKTNNAIAAINGGFFDMRNGGSVTQLIVNQQQINTTPQKLIEQGNEILEGMIGINAKGKLSVNSSVKSNKKKYHSLLITGPLLLLKGKPQELVDRKFNTDQHPRSCICTCKNGKTLMITTDGRHKEAAGFSLHDLTELATALGCKNAVNLDGGGSTTLWAKNATPNGVVNCPSDNKRFDHEGERPCANAILVLDL
ncbi:MAG: phosphodiester glycosidase family protein [Bacteroidota bacterium]